MTFFCTEVTPGSDAYGKRLSARDERQAISTASGIAIHRARDKGRTATLLVCETRQTQCVGAPAIIRPIAYVSADVRGVSSLNVLPVDKAAYIAEIMAALNFREPQS